MKISKLIKTSVCLLLLAAMTVSIGCAHGTTTPVNSPNNTEGQAQSTKSPTVLDGTLDLMKGYKAQSMEAPTAPDAASAAKAADFALRLYRAAEGEGNKLVSPLSVLCALSMTANGARGNTLAQIESLLGMSCDELNEFYRNYSAQLPGGEKYKLNLANSVWFTSDSRFTVNEDFLQTNADFYGADVYKAPFDDTTLHDINSWVKEATDGMIPEVLDSIPDSAVMYLINALAFDAEWEQIYKKYEVSPRDFTLEDGSKKKTDFMFSTEGEYLSSDNAEGFIKYYSGRKYAFAALLPNEGTTAAELIASLDGEKLMAILSDAESCSVSAAMPKFEYDYETLLNDTLASMGMTDAFVDYLADLSGLGTSTAGNIFINRVIHKTFIAVDERGTKAGAATVVEGCDEAAAISEHSVYLDRPFVYMIIDCETNLPLFIGTLMEP